jgi:hypothetical protein
MEDITLEHKKLLIQRNITEVNGSIYDATIKKRVAVITKDKAMEDNCNKSLEGLVKMRDEFEKILKEVEETK